MFFFFFHSATMKIVIFVLIITLTLGVIAKEGNIDNPFEGTLAQKDHEEVKKTVRDENSGSCGSLSWNFNEKTSTLTISGQGVMSCCNSSYTPWSQFSEQTQNIEIKGGVSSIYQRAFFNFTSLKTVNITSNITSIGYGAFSICKNLISITIPSSVTLIG